ncbi:hypothetical protein DPMN_089343 [Dreissena polymorpha]|uniref:Uncharacterized protein n=1 Tax=Dreissena polymorpha TaxID=45954 RepID=A0A9D4KY27_DREPO|nr:hypothetical protein DPMN_089343 [Dreissena polymorpha]
MTRVRKYDDDRATIRWRQCDSTMTTMRECEDVIVRWRPCESTMTTVRQYDGDNAIERWRQCDDTMATARYDYLIVAIVLSHCLHRIVAL